MDRRSKQTFLQGEYTDDQQSYEKMFNTTSYQRNVNQNYNEMPHISQNVYHLKIHKQMLERVWRKRNPPTLLVRMQIVAATMENSMKFP